MTMTNSFVYIYLIIISQPSYDRYEIIFCKEQFIDRYGSIVSYSQTTLNIPQLWIIRMANNRFTYELTVHLNRSESVNASEYHNHSSTSLLSGAMQVLPSKVLPAARARTLRTAMPRSLYVTPKVISVDHNTDQAQRMRQYCLLRVRSGAYSYFYGGACVYTPLRMKSLLDMCSVFVFVFFNINQFYKYRIYI